jgi:hypothetical protein
MTAELQRKVQLESYWQDIPIGAENAVTYEELCVIWNKNARAVRKILHDLSIEDNGDDFVLIRSGHGKGFYRTDDEYALNAYRKECLNKGRSNFAPIKKINRILKGNAEALQGSVFNNLKGVRLSKGLKQRTVCLMLTRRGLPIDTPTLSKMENGTFLPPPNYLMAMADIYGVEPCELVMVEDIALGVYARN